MNQRIRLNERASLNRPAWSSMELTGLWRAFRHLHIGTKDRPIVKNYFDKSKGMMR